MHDGRAPQPLRHLAELGDHLGADGTLVLGEEVFGHGSLPGSDPSRARAMCRRSSSSEFM